MVGGGAARSLSSFGRHQTAATVVEILTAQTDGAAAQYLFALSLMEESPDLPTAIQVWVWGRRAFRCCV